MTGSAKSCGWKAIRRWARARLTMEAATGDIVDERYDSLPTSYVIRRAGALPRQAGADLR